MVSGHFEEHHGNDCLCIIILVEIIKMKTISRRQRKSSIEFRRKENAADGLYVRGCRDAIAEF